MKLLEAETTAAPEAAQQTPDAAQASQEQPSPPEGARTCRACGAVMEPEQDWCLTCGTAAPGRLGERPGWRAASTVMALTAVLVLGAVAASFAALNDDGNKQQPTVAAVPPASAPAAQAPPAATQPATPTPTQTTPSTPKSSATATLPKVKTPKAPSSASSAPLTATTPTPTPAPSTPSSGASTPTSTGTSTGTTSPSSTSTQGNSSSPAETGPTPIDVPASAGSAYDPYGRATATGDTAKALDGDASTSWYVDPKDPQEVGVGYAVDVGKLRGIRQFELTTPTPGFRIEVYATDEAELPPDILDTRWSHITNVTDVGAKNDGKETVVLGAGTSKYRNLLLWFTKPPTDGARLRLSELKLFG